MKKIGKRTAYTFLCAIPGRSRRNRLRAWLYRRYAYWPDEWLVEAGDTVTQVGTPNPSKVRLLRQACGPSGRLVVFEASSKNFATLKDSRTDEGALGKLDLVNKAVFSTAGSMPLMLSASHPGDHVLAGLDAEVDNFERQDAQYGETEQVECDTLDHLLSDLNVSSPDVLIVTVNGAELDVLMGSSSVLSAMPSGSRVFVKGFARKAGGETIRDDLATCIRDHGFTTTATHPSKTVSARAEWSQRDGDVFAFKR